jgi:hypothetical protein
MDRGGEGGRSVAPLLGQSVQYGPHLGSSLTGAWVSSCRFQKVLNRIKRSPDGGVMPVLPNPSLRRISSNSRHQIWQMIYPFRSSRRVFCNVVLWFFFLSTSRLLFCRSWLGHVFGVVCLANSVVFLFSPCKSQLHQNSWKYVSVNPNKVI